MREGPAGQQVVEHAITIAYYNLVVKVLHTLETELEYRRAPAMEGYHFRA